MPAEFGVVNIVALIAYLVLAPFVGGFLAGLDRKISARMQGRFGPPVLQPFYDVSKLRQKEAIT
ncbi:MAG: NADH-quinone oxidoreductase subunit H, partial [Bacillota bacterium]|nr:NADH-quinone oxidoreductase subunit H [Bacillota bacterium]